MKYIIMVLFVLIPLLCKSQTTQYINPENIDAHTSINVAGGDISSEEGSVSFSIGQVFYASYNDEQNHVTEGIQQPLIIYITPLGKTEEESFRVAAYPNPVANFFRIEASTYTNRSLRYQLMDLNGRFLQEGRIEESGAKVDVSRLSVAIYLLKITDNGNHIKTIKILKK